MGEGAVLVLQASQADSRKTVAARGLVNGRGPPDRRDGGRDSAKRVVFRGSACEPTRTAQPASSIPGSEKMSVFLTKCLDYQAIMRRLAPKCPGLGVGPGIVFQ